MQDFIEEELPEETEEVIEVNDEEYISEDSFEERHHKSRGVNDEYFEEFDYVDAEYTDYDSLNTETVETVSLNSLYSEVQYTNFLLTATIGIMIGGFMSLMLYGFLRKSVK